MRGEKNKREGMGGETWGDGRGEELEKGGSEREHREEAKTRERRENEREKDKGRGVVRREGFLFFSN